MRRIDVGDLDLRDIVIASPPAGQEQRFLATNNLTLQWQYGAMCDPSQDNVPGILTFIDETAARTIPHSQMEVNLCAGGATLPALEDWLSTLPHANYPTTLASSRRLTKRQPQDRNVVIRFSLHLRHAHRGHIGGYSNGQLLLLTPTQRKPTPCPRPPVFNRIDADSGKAAIRSAFLPRSAPHHIDLVSRRRFVASDAT